MDEAIKASIILLNSKKEDAEGHYGDSEVRDALLSIAHHHCRIGNKSEAVDAYNVAMDKTVGAGGRLDIILTLIRIGIFEDDITLMQKQVLRAKEQLDKGGDWERKNKLLLYEGVVLMLSRNFKAAAHKFIGALDTFTALEMFSFKTCITYTVLTAMAACERPELKKSVASSPEVLHCLDSMPILKSFLLSFVNCDYKLFMSSLVGVMDLVRSDRILHRHTLYLVRVYRLRAYKQFLDPYRSVTVKSMGECFGLSPSFIEKELSDFISAGKLACKIDKVGGVIEGNVTDPRSASYHQVVKDGDLLLNRLQKLSRVIDL
eukprot:GHVR01060599.1.p1 GENE.GHVR01060599.1~~GHVR01060599.1.p1  ORF type:complete len:318 (+),score=52.61 GHVR01060599.1:3-956(+)